MPRIIDNIHEQLLPALQQSLAGATCADFCVGYFNLRGWDQLAETVEHFSGTAASCCRVLVGMHQAPEDTMRQLQTALKQDEFLDGPTAARLKRDVIQTFKTQIEFGVPTAAAEAALRTLARQLRAGKVVVKLFLAFPLHAKLYLVHRQDYHTPLIGYVGSSNLTFRGLSGQGELNVDVLEQDAAVKLQNWFDDRWGDELSFDISAELAELIETSWAAERLVSPYHLYLKIASHLSEEARQGEREFKVPEVLRGVLLDFQEKAVSLVAHYLHQRDGVLLGDVVGLGKTLMAVAVARIFQEDDSSNALIICPPKLQSMWQWHVDRYGLAARVLSSGQVIEALPGLPRYRLVIIDESHNLRNREGKRYHAVRDYIDMNEPRVLLLTATPYNKQYTDVSNQLRLFLDEDQDLRVRPERFFQDWEEEDEQGQRLSEADFVARFQASPRSLRAFEQSGYPDDWRDLLRLFMVRRTRRFIKRNYAQYDPERKRHYVLLNGQPSYFPKRKPKTLRFKLDESDPDDPYARLYQESVVRTIGELTLPRYGLVNYLVPNAERRANAEQKRILDNLNRAGRRLIGFCRTNLFKRLESDGYSFLLSLDRHVLRNMVTLHALETGAPVPIGTQDAATLDTAVSDTDEDWVEENIGEDPGVDQLAAEGVCDLGDGAASYSQRAAHVYQSYRTRFASRFHWLDTRFFQPQLAQALRADTQALLAILQQAGDWKPRLDAKLNALHRLVTKTLAGEKVLVFTQFADTAVYLTEQLVARGVADLEGVVGDSSDPTTSARRFSPGSNGGLLPGESELRILIATDVLAEGQNLQDAYVVVNFDLPWAIIRLIQRAGRVDRIGQAHDTILVYSCMRADGVEKIIRLRQRLEHRLQQNQEVIGTDESFFGEDVAAKLRDLYTEKDDVLDDDEDEDVDLASIALQIWNSAAAADRQAADKLPAVVAAARPWSAESGPDGVITYLRFPDDTDALVRVDEQGRLVSQSLVATFLAAACAPDTPTLPRAENHHELVARAVQLATQEQVSLGGQLGSLRSTRRKVWERLKRYREGLQRQPDLFSAERLRRLTPALDVLFRYPLKDAARDSLGRQIRLGIGDEGLAEMLIHLYEEERLGKITEEVAQPEPRVVCSLGLRG